MDVCINKTLETESQKKSLGEPSDFHKDNHYFLQ